MKKTLSVFLMLALILSMNIAFADTTTSVTGNTITDNPVSLDIWMINDREAHFSRAIEAYQTEHPNVTINISYLDTNTLKNNEMIAAASDTLPDIYYNYSGTIGAYYPQNGYAMDLTEYAAANSWESLYLPEALRLCTWNGKVSGIPMTYNTFDVLYRKDIFEKLNLAEPTTWEEFENCLAVLKENGIVPWAIGANSNWDLQRVFTLVLEAFAGSELNDALCSTWTADWTQTPAVKQAFEKIHEWYDKGYFIEGFLTLSPNDARNLWYQGQCAMRVDGFIWNMISNDRDMSQYGVFHMPSALEGQETRCSNYNTCCMLNSKLSQEQFNVAIDFIEFALVNPDFDSYKSYPVSYQAATYPNVEGFELLTEILEDNKTYGTMPTFDTMLPSSVHAKFSSAMEMYLSDMVSVEDVIAMVQAELDAYIAENK